MHKLPSKVPAWKRDYFVVRSSTGWPFPTDWRIAVQDPGVILDGKTKKELQSLAQLGLHYKDFTSEEKLVRASLSPGRFSPVWLSALIFASGY